MKSTLTVITTLCVALTVTTFASAAPILTATGTQLPGSLYAWDVFFDGNDGLIKSAAVDLKFVGDIHQTPSLLGFLPDTTLDNKQTNSGFGPPNPVLDVDSYLFFGTAPIAGLPTENGGAATWGNSLPTGIDNPNGNAGGVSGTDTSGLPMWMSNGTTTGLQGEVFQVAHVVIDQSIVDAAATLTITGRLARDGNTFNNQQFIFTAMPTIPEPSSIVMLSMGAVALVGVGLRRRRRQS